MDETKTVQTTNVPLAVIEAADKQAQEDGLNSLQDAIRIFLRKYSQGNISLSIHLVEHLSAAQEMMYDKESNETLKAIKQGRRKVYKNSKSMIKDLLND